MNVCLDLENLFKDAWTTTIAEDVRRQIEVEDLLGTYSVDYIVGYFSYVTTKYGFTRTELEKMAPACIEQRRRETAHQASVCELMGKAVGAEGKL